MSAGCSVSAKTTSCDKRKKAVHISRAHYKLEQIDQRYRIIKPGQRVLELGAAPGGWTHYLENKLRGGMLIAIDSLPITCGQDTQVIEGMAGDEVVDRKIDDILDGEQLDLVLSDMAPQFLEFAR